MLITKWKLNSTKTSFGLGYRGLTLVEVLLSLVVSSFLLMGIASLFGLLAKMQVRQSTGAAFAAFNAEVVDNLERRCAWANTIQDPANEALNCLLDGSCVNGHTGTFTVKTTDDVALYAPNALGTLTLDRYGKKCTSEQTDMSVASPCEIQFSLGFKVVCGGDCSNPQLHFLGDYTTETLTSNIGGPNADEPMTLNVDRWDFSYVMNHERFYRSCREALDAGMTASQLVWIDPDGPGGLCPEQIYCDQAKDGGGWALVVNAPVADYQEIPVISPPVLRTERGRLSNEFIQALLTRSSDSTINNIRVDVRETTAGRQVVSQQVLGSSSVGTFTSNNPTCAAFDSTIHAAQVTGDVLGFRSANNAGSSVGFFDGVLSGGAEGAGTSGFHCLACGETNTCGLAPTVCCQKQLPGSVWVR